MLQCYLVCYLCATLTSCPFRTVIPFPIGPPVIPLLSITCPCLHTKLPHQTPVCQPLTPLPGHLTAFRLQSINLPLTLTETILPYYFRLFVITFIPCNCFWSSSWMCILTVQIKTEGEKNNMLESCCVWFMYSTL